MEIKNILQINSLNEVSQEKTKQLEQENKLLFNFDEEPVNNGYSAMGFENKTKETVKFNADGTITHSYDYENDGIIDKEVTKDKNGNTKEVVEYSFGTRSYKDGTEVPLKIAEHEYYDNGKLTASKKAHIINGEEVSREEFTYTVGGTSNSYAKYENGKLTIRTETSFYDDGEILPESCDVEKELRIYDENNQLVTIVEFTYPKNEQGKVIAKVEKETNVKTGEVTIYRND